MYIKPNIKTNINIVNKKNHIPTEYDFYIGRPSILGNPYSHKKESIANIIVESVDIAIDSYKEYFYNKIKCDDIDFINELNILLSFYKENKKLNLVCWCYPKRCHGEIIKEYLENILISEFYKKIN